MALQFGTRMSIWDPEFCFGGYFFHEELDLEDYKTILKLLLKSINHIKVRWTLAERKSLPLT